MSLLRKIPFIKTSINNIVNKEVCYAMEQYDKDKKRQRGEMMESIAYFKIGLPIIIIPNDTSPITVGIIDGIHQVDSFIPVVTDYVENTQVICMTNYIDFNEQNLKAVLKLSAHERGGVFYHHQVAQEEGHEAVDRDDAVERTFEQIQEALVENGFYEEAKKYWDSMNYC